MVASRGQQTGNQTVLLVWVSTCGVLNTAGWMKLCLCLGRAIAVEEELKERSEVSQWWREETRQEVQSHNQVHFLFVLTEPDFYFCRFFVLAAVMFHVTDWTLCRLLFLLLPLLLSVVSVVGATSLSAGPPSPPTVCCPVETCKSPPSLPA